MKRMLMLVAALLFSSYCLAETDANTIHSAVQNAFSTASSSSIHTSSMIYSGKDISRPKMTVADERAATTQPRIVG